MIWSSVEFVSICVYIVLGHMLLLFDFMVTEVTFLLLQTFFILFFYFIVSWSREASYGDYGESCLSESLNFDMGAGTGWNFHGCFLWAKCECIILRKERWISVILVIKKAGGSKNCWLLPDMNSSHFIFSFIYMLLILLFLQWKFNFYISSLLWSSDQIRSVAQSCPTLCDPMNRSTPGLPVHHQIPEFTETHVHRVSDAIQPSHPLLSLSPPAPNPSQHQSLFQWVNSSHEVAKVLEFQL